MDTGTASGAEETESEDGNSIKAVRAVVLKKVELLRLYPLIRGPLRALEKLRLTAHEVLERFTTL